jgi:hypothetical protein
MSTAPTIPEKEPAVSPYGKRWTRWIRPVSLALLLIVFDALGVYAFLIGAFLLLVYLPLSLKAKKYAACRRERLIRLAIYLAAVAVVLILIPVNGEISQERAERIIAAVESYHTANGEYPERLDQLVPQFIDAVPAKARISFADTGFRYFAGSPGSHTLTYVVMPPFGRRVYYFESKAWSYLD